MKSSRLYLIVLSRSLLVKLMGAHVFGTIFAYAVYINISSLGDGYLPESFEGFTEENISAFSTMLVHAIYAYLGIVLPGFLAPMVLGLIVAYVTWHAFRDVYPKINHKLFWACNLLPHFLVWSGSSSKEQIVIICGIIVVDFAARRLFLVKKLKTSEIFYVLASLWFIYVIRPNYFVMYFLIMATPLLGPFLNKTIINRFTIGLYFFIFIVAIAGLSFAAYLDSKFINEDVVVFMKAVEASFLTYESGSNRTNIQWNDASDFLYNSFWGIPQGFIGPTLLEVILKPIQIPVFFEGMVYLLIIGYLFLNLFRVGKVSNGLRVHILLYFFVTMIIIFVSYPYLMFNPGSALRYKQSMHPILVFYPLLILAYVRVNDQMKNTAKTLRDDAFRFVHKLK